MSVCRNSVNSFIGLPPLLEEDHFSQAFHQTLGVPSPPSTPPNFLNLTLNPLKPIKVLDPLTTSPAVSAGDLAGDSINSGHIIDLMSCTESLGFESSDEMISNLDDLGSSESCNSRSNNGELSSSSSSLSSSFFLRRREKRVSSLLEEKNFPPPLTSLSENGRRNFTLKSMRKDGRLQIVGVMTEHPEILYASRDNGRLRLHLVKDVNHHHHHDHHDNHDEKEKNTEEREKEEEEREKTQEENQEDDVAEEDDDDEEEEEREWKNPTVGRLRRWCYYHRPMHVWGPQQQQNTRYVTTI